MQNLIRTLFAIAVLPATAYSQPANLIEAAGNQFNMGVGIDDNIHEMPDDWALLKKRRC
jgi:hypothetical protein